MVQHGCTTFGIPNIDSIMSVIGRIRACPGVFAAVAVASAYCYCVGGGGGSVAASGRNGGYVYRCFLLQIDTRQSAASSQVRIGVRNAYIHMRVKGDANGVGSRG